MSGFLGSAGGIPGLGHNGGPPMLGGTPTTMPLVVDAQMIGMSDAEQRVWAFFNNQAQRIDREVFAVQYPDIRYPGLVPVDTAGGEWLQTITYYSSDRLGQAQWFHAGAQDVPLVQLTRNRFGTTVQMASIGYGFNEEELANATANNINLTNDKADACRRAAEEFIDRVVLFGDSSMGFVGLTNSPAVTAGSAAADGTGSSALWANKTPDQILRDVNAILTGIWTVTNQVEMANTLLLPLQAYTDIITRRLTVDSDTTVFDFLMRANIYTAETGQRLTVRALYGLNTAGSGGTGRIVAYRRQPDVLRFHMPMPFQFRAPWRKGPLMYEVPGIFRLGGLDIRRPGAMRYLDGTV